jgi:uncharacterized protein
MYNKGAVEFEWDEESKAGMNFRKHGVRMPEAIPVFDDPYALTIVDDESDPGERRFITLGLGAAGRLLVVAYTWRDKTSESSRRVPRRGTSVRNTRRNHEGQIRL